MTSAPPMDAAYGTTSNAPGIVIAQTMNAPVESASCQNCFTSCPKRSQIGVRISSTPKIHLTIHSSRSKIMARAITRQNESEYSKMLLKNIPTEIIGCYVSINGLLSANPENPNWLFPHAVLPRSARSSAGAAENPASARYGRPGPRTPRAAAGR